MVFVITAMHTTKKIGIVVVPLDVVGVAPEQLP
jgi:hypothetical protein